jgi:hypothetical protein
MGTRHAVQQGGRENFFSRLGWSVWWGQRRVKNAIPQLTPNLQALQR